VQLMPLGTGAEEGERIGRGSPERTGGSELRLGIGVARVQAARASPVDDRMPSGGWTAPPLAGRPGVRLM
jgi:hypothetical protein